MSDKNTGSVKRMALIAVGIVVAVLAIAWFHGGEVPVRPIAEPVAMPETVGPVRENEQ